MTTGTRILESGARALCDLADRIALPKLSILIFHRVHRESDPLFPDEMTASRFDAVCRMLKANFRVMALRDALGHLRARTLPARALSITFDDGYADNAVVALPILLEHGLQATFFVATGFLDGGRMFNDTAIECIRSTRADTIDLSGFGLGRRDIRDLRQRRHVIDDLLPRLKHLQLDEREAGLHSLLDHAGRPTLPSGLMMRSTQVQALHRSGMEVGAHTVHHPILQVLADDDAEGEIAQGRSQLEQLIDAPVECFAYPNGRPSNDYGARDVALVRKLGFKGAVSTAVGVGDSSADMYQLPRFTPWDSSPAKWLTRLSWMRVRGVSPSVA